MLNVFRFFFNNLFIGFSDSLQALLRSGNRLSDYFTYRAAHTRCVYIIRSMLLIRLVNRTDNLQIRTLSHKVQCTEETAAKRGVSRHTGSNRLSVTKRNYARQEMYYRSSPEPPEHSTTLSLSLSLTFSTLSTSRTASTRRRHPPVHLGSRRLEEIHLSDWMDLARKSPNQSSHSIIHPIVR